MTLSWLPGILYVVLCLVLPQECSSGTRNRQLSFGNETKDVSALLISNTVKNEVSSNTSHQHSTEQNDTSAKSHDLMKQNETSRINHYLSRVKRISPTPPKDRRIVPWGHFKKHQEYNHYYWGFTFFSLKREGLIKDFFSRRYNFTYMMGTKPWKKPLIFHLFYTQRKHCLPVFKKPFDCIFNRLMTIRQLAYLEYNTLKDKPKFKDVFGFDREQLVCMFLR